MINKNHSIFKYAVPIIALVVVAIHFILANKTQLSPWKGGGFGMYSEMHYYYNHIVVTDLTSPIDSLMRDDKNVARSVMRVKRSPNTNNLKHIAEVVSKYAKSDTIKIQIWKPLINSQNSSYSRELIEEYQFIKL